LGGEAFGGGLREKTAFMRNAIAVFRITISLSVIHLEKNCYHISNGSSIKLIGNCED